MTPPLEADRQADADLLQRVAAGEELAFQEFVEATFIPVVRTVLSVVRSKSMTDEVVQEVFLEAWKIAHRYHPELGSARTWVTVIAHRRAVDRVRRQVSATRREALYISGLGKLDINDPAEFAVHAEDLYRALRKLPYVQRTVLVLAYFYGHTQTEMAILLGVPLGTVKTRVRDGLKQLRRLI